MRAEGEKLMLTLMMTMTMTRMMMVTGRLQRRTEVADCCWLGEGGPETLCGMACRAVVPRPS